jgi:F420-non-reducing hydrogenase iron-sulfur subunit
MPTNIRIIRVNCTGRIDPVFLLRAIESGADGVLISGCHIGDCHYTEGNVHAVKRFNFLKKILDEMGLGDRMLFEHVSASEGQKWAEVVTNFVKKIKGLGPSPFRGNTDLIDLHLDDENYTKKARIHDLLQVISKKMDYEPKEPFVFDPEEVSEGFGFPKRDPDKCIGCYACYNVCPENAITYEDVENKRKYGTLHSFCLVCRECERVCPQEAIEITSGFELLSFLKDEPVWGLEVPLEKCSICGEYFNPIPFCDEVKNRLVTKNEEKRVTDLDLPFDPYRTCPDCKRHRIAQVIAEVAHPAMKEIKKKS